MMKRKQWMLMLCLAVSTLACIGTCEMIAEATAGLLPEPQSQDTGYSWYPPETFEETQLIGTWESLLYNTPEMLILRDDYTFRQVYQDPCTGYYFETDGTWQLEYRPSGCLYLHLNGARFYYGSLETAENGNRYPSDGELLEFWDVCEERMIEMPDKAVLLVTSSPDFPNNVRLLHMRTGKNGNNQIFRLIGIATPSP